MKVRRVCRGDGKNKGLQNAVLRNQFQASLFSPVDFLILFAVEEQSLIYLESIWNIFGNGAEEGWTPLGLRARVRDVKTHTNMHQNEPDRKQVVLLDTTAKKHLVCMLVTYNSACCTFVHRTQHRCGTSGWNDAFEATTFLVAVWNRSNQL